MALPASSAREAARTEEASSKRAPGARWAAHEARKAEFVRAIREASAAPRLAKDTTNLFRIRKEVPRPRLDVRHMTHVLDVDPARGIVEVEGMCPYERLVDACLPHGVMPAVVPELKSITIGGALAGIGIESSSFRYGLVHETIEEYDVLLPGGEVVLVRPDNEHADLFHGFPNSYGTLGYALRIRAKVVPVKPYVRLEHRRFDDVAAYFAALAEACAGGSHDFVEGEVFAPGSMYLSTGRFVDRAPYTSDYTFERIYYRSIPQRAEDHLKVRDYIWRWDTDWFWCSRVTGAQNPLLRRLLFGRKRLNSMFYMKLMRLSARYDLLGRAYRALGYRSEAVIQDIAIPLAQAPTFLEWFHREIGILPIWNCPVRALPRERSFELFPLRPDALYVNFGFWDAIRRREDRPPAYYNRLIEEKARELGGVKSLYSDAFYSREEFAELYRYDRYRALKARYDPEGRLADLYDKVINRS